MSSHYLILNLNYELPLKSDEQATVDLYQKLFLNKETINVLGCKCNVAGIRKSFYNNDTQVEFNVTIVEDKV